MSESYISEVERLRDGERAADAEIELLRERVRYITEQRDGLLTGLGQKDAEIERLRSDLAAMSDSVAVAAKALNDEEQEIERLRELLREMLEDGYVHVPYGASHEDVSAIRDFEKRVSRAVLGEPE